jgi:hypothetical protein
VPIWVHSKRAFDLLTDHNLQSIGHMAPRLMSLMLQYPKSSLSICSVALAVEDQILVINPNMIDEFKVQSPAILSREWIHAKVMHQHSGPLERS